jgi:uncharacterized membrane protein (DUF485 family)
LNKILIATIIFFASYAGTIGLAAFAVRKMWVAAAVSYAAGWAGWGIAFLIGGPAIAKVLKKHKKTIKDTIIWIIKGED